MNDGILRVAGDRANREVGQHIAESLVTERWAACVNVVPNLWSVYRWQGKLEKEPEELLVIKTRDTLVEPVSARVRELHPYTVPEVIALPITAGSADYLNWMQAETREP